MQNQAEAPVQVVEAPQDVIATSEAQLAEQGLHQQVEDRRLDAMTRSLSGDPLVQTPEGNLVRQSEYQPSADAGPYSGGRRA